MVTIITVTTRDEIEVSGEFESITYHPETSREGVWLFLKNCTSECDKPGFKNIPQQGFALCDVKKVVTHKEQKEEQS